jgi:hypothetical protein
VWFPGGGVKKIETRKLEWEKQSKVGSTNNINHKPGGGKVKVTHPFFKLFVTVIAHKALAPPPPRKFTEIYQAGNLPKYTFNFLKRTVARVLDGFRKYCGRIKH